MPDDNDLPFFHFTDDEPCVQNSDVSYRRQKELEICTEIKNVCTKTINEIPSLLRVQNYIIM